MTYENTDRLFIQFLKEVVFYLCMINIGSSEPYVSASPSSYNVCFQIKYHLPKMI